MEEIPGADMSCFSLDSGKKPEYPERTCKPNHRAAKLHCAQVLKITLDQFTFSYRESRCCAVPWLTAKCATSADTVLKALENLYSHIIQVLSKITALFFFLKKCFLTGFYHRCDALCSWYFTVKRSVFLGMLVGFMLFHFQPSRGQAHSLSVHVAQQLTVSLKT